MARAAASLEPVVGGITPLTTIDYPGELAAVLYLQGCPWRCRYCHNGELLPRRGRHVIPWSDVLGWLSRRRGLIDAVVFSGGEATLQRTLPKAIGEVRAMDFKVGLHTAGCYPRRLAAVLPLLDWVGMDIKAPFARYAEITGVPGSGESACASARLLINSGVLHQFRTTRHPMLLSDADIEQSGLEIAALGGTPPMLQSCTLEHCYDPGLRR